MMKVIARRFGIAALLAIPAFTGLAPLHAQQCNFTPPPEWSGATTIRWFGPCERGVASGAGVLRMYLNAKPGAAFYGRMRNGAPQFGVIESPEGFAAGTLVGGVVQPTDNRQVMIDAFRAAASAARATSARFKAENNAGSAKFYADKARQLENQMD